MVVLRMKSIYMLYTNLNINKKSCICQLGKISQLLLTQKTQLKKKKMSIIKYNWAKKANNEDD